MKCVAHCDAALMMRRLISASAAVACAAREWICLIPIVIIAFFLCGVLGGYRVPYVSHQQRDRR